MGFRRGQILAALNLCGDLLRSEQGLAALEAIASAVGGGVSTIDARTTEAAPVGALIAQLGAVRDTAEAAQARSVVYVLEAVIERLRGGRVADLYAFVPPTDAVAETRIVAAARLNDLAKMRAQALDAALASTGPLPLADLVNAVATYAARYVRSADSVSECAAHLRSVLDGPAGKVLIARSARRWTGVLRMVNDTIESPMSTSPDWDQPIAAFEYFVEYELVLLLAGMHLEPNSDVKTVRREIARRRYTFQTQGSGGVERRGAPLPAIERERVVQFLRERYAKWGAK